MRPIDADRLKELFIFTCTGGGLLGQISNMIIKWACSFVDEMPTIDAEPVRQMAAANLTVPIIIDRKDIEEYLAQHDNKDCISRQAAIRWVKTECNPYGKPTLDFESGKKVIEHLEQMPSAEPEPQWIPVSERLPECEQEVLVCTKKQLVGKDVFIDSIVTPAIYEDGTMRENDSEWHWEDIDFAGWDEEEDCGIIPEGWWENRHFNPDGVYNNPVDRKVIACMPLPEPYQEVPHAT